MSVRRRLAVLTLAGALAALVASGPASAESDGIPVTDVSWYSAAQPATPEGSPVPPPKPPTPDVPTGDFAVGSQLGQVTRESFLHIDTSSLPPGSTVGSLVLTVKEDTAGGNLNAGAAAVQAVPANGYFSGGVAGAPISEAPPVDASGAVDGKRGADGSWTFEIGPIVAKWLDGSLANNGIGLVPKIDPANPFQVVFSGSSPVPNTSGQVMAPADSGTDAGSDISPVAGSGDLAPSAPIDIAPDTSGTFTAPGLPPAAAGAAPATGATARPVVRTAARSHHGIPVTFFVGVLAVAGLVALAAIVLGDQGEPVPARRGSVLRRLERPAGVEPTG